MKALPHHRNDILLGMASFLGRLSEDHPEVSAPWLHLACKAQCWRAWDGHNPK